MSIDIRLYTVTLLVRSSPFLHQHYKANTIWGSLSTAKCKLICVFYVLRHDVSHRIALSCVRGALKRCSHRGFRGSQRGLSVGGFAEKSKKILDISQYIHRLSSPNSTTKTRFFHTIAHTNIIEYNYTLSHTITHNIFRLRITTQ